jgi:ribosomal protein L36
MKLKASYSKEECEGERFLRRKRVCKEEEKHREDYFVTKFCLEYEDFLFEDVTP